VANQAHPSDSSEDLRLPDVVIGFAELLGDRDTDERACIGIEGRGTMELGSNGIGWDLGTERALKVRQPVFGGGDGDDHGDGGAGAGGGGHGDSVDHCNCNATWEPAATRKEPEPGKPAT
jgi:hypothetical protein